MYFFLYSIVHIDQVHLYMQTGWFPTMRSKPTWNSSVSSWHLAVHSLYPCTHYTIMIRLEHVECFLSLKSNTVNYLHEHNLCFISITLGLYQLTRGLVLSEGNENHELVMSAIMRPGRLGAWLSGSCWEASKYQQHITNTADWFASFIDASGHVDILDYPT